MKRLGSQSFVLVPSNHIDQNNLPKCNCQVKSTELNSLADNNNLGGRVKDSDWSRYSDPRDKVYALLRLARDIDFPVDYSKSFFSAIF